MVSVREMRGSTAGLISPGGMDSLCGGYFCQNCLDHTLKHPRLFDGPRSVCSICFERVKAVIERKQQEREELFQKKASTNPLSISSPTVIAPGAAEGELPSIEVISKSLEKFMVSRDSQQELEWLIMI